MTDDDLPAIIAPDGTASAMDPQLDDATLLRIHRTMLLVRRVDERAAKLQRQGRIASHIGWSGQEASHVGSALALAPHDWMFPSYREAGAAVLRGLSLRTLFCQLFGNAEDLQKGHQMPAHWGDRRVNVVTSSSPLGTQLPLAVGAAFAARYLGDPAITLVYFGDGATSTSDFHAAMNFAGVWRAPTVFFCANNKYAISVPIEMQTASKTLAVKAVAYGFEGVRVDGADPLAVYVATRQAVEKARRGDGPTLIEAVAERLVGHTSADDPSRYRDAAEMQAARTRDPLLRFQRYLERKDLWSPAYHGSCIKAIDTEIAEAVAYAERVPKPDLRTLFEDVYATVPAHLDEQRQQALAESSLPSPPAPVDVVSLRDEEDAQRGPYG